MTVTRTLLGVLLLAAGCASYDGRGLVPGQSRAADVEALMGQPAERIAGEGGDSVWFYPRNPGGPHSYAVTVSANGVVRSVEQRLTVENMYKLRIGATTAKEVRALLGPPWRVSRLPRQEREVWHYYMYSAVQVDSNLYVQFSGDGVVREVLLLRDLRNDVGDTRL